MKHNLTDKEIGEWSLKKFPTTLKQQMDKLREETQEMMFELADMWIVICGIKARGSTAKFPDYNEFCKQYSVNPVRFRSIINQKLLIDDQSPYDDVDGVLKRRKLEIDVI